METPETKFRAGKPDFKPLYENHRAILERNNVDMKQIIEVRHQIHS